MFLVHSQCAQLLHRLANFCRGENRSDYEERRGKNVPRYLEIRQRKKQRSRKARKGARLCFSRYIRTIFLKPR